MGAWHVLGTRVACPVSTCPVATLPPTSNRAESSRAQHLTATAELCKSPGGAGSLLVAESGV
jgi:hypothetical protein